MISITRVVKRMLLPFAAIPVAANSGPPFMPRMIARFAVLIILLWVGLTAVVNLAIPQLEVVGKAHSVSLSPKDATAVQAIKHVGQVFHEFESNSSVTIVLEGDKPLGSDAHRFYDELMRKLSAAPSTSRTSRTSGVTR
ncbi:hypothetical protein MSTO_26740 [Mycobacterium stomatepiae]|uniref:Membrane transport protein MMPL domain-containing protein n=1 Tax=Mycobacterium stomatepiae TaxID=470076 RepID=A0A7I7Q872_9MYCO|nr:hypothetical protein MSTO_26740 [Mycobacterium stomatepiae]